MKKKAAKMMASIAVMGLLLVPVQQAEGAAASYKNCTELNKAYPGGVAVNATVKNKGGKTKYKPAVAPAVYSAHKKMDRDKDGIACER